MRCPKCGFISFDDLAACAKCHTSILEKASAFEGTAIRTEPVFFLQSLLGSRPAAPEPEEETALDSTDAIYQELAAESLGAGLAVGQEEGEAFDLGALDLDEGGESEQLAGPPPAAGGEEDVPTVNLSSFAPQEEAAEAAAPAEDLSLELPDLEIEEEEGQVSSSPREATSNLEGIDLSDLLPEEEGPADTAAAVPAARGEESGIFDLSDLMTSEGDAEDFMRIDAESPLPEEEEAAAALSMGEEEAAAALSMGEEEAAAVLSMGEEEAAAALSLDEEGEGEGLLESLHLDLTMEETAASESEGAAGLGLDFAEPEPGELDGEDMALRLDLDEAEPAENKEPGTEPTGLPPSGLTMENGEDG